MEQEKIDLSTVLYFDTETTGTAKDSRVVQLAWQFAGATHNYIIKPDGYEIPEAASDIHRITTDVALEKGVPIRQALEEFIVDAQKARYMCAHNLNFDKARLIYEIGLLYSEEEVAEYTALFNKERCLDTMMSTVSYVKAPFANGRSGYKWPKLRELREKLIEDGKIFSDFNAHDANEDVRCLAECHAHLVEMGLM